MKREPYREQDDLLRSLLKPLIHEWGIGKVLACIDEIRAAAQTSEHQAKRQKSSNNTSRKPSAVEIANRTELPETKRRALLDLASLFDRKHFLPTSADVKSFLELRAQRPGTIKQRQDAFRSVLALLSDMSDEELERQIRNSTHAGPAQLGPLSDAIRSTGAAMRSSDSQKDDSDRTPPDQRSVSFGNPERESG